MDTRRAAGASACSTGTLGLKAADVRKKYVGKTCVYCAEATSASGDHVFAREFFLKVYRANLPQVPACDACNRAKSELEHYFVTLLPFGARHPVAERNLREQVPGRIAKNRKLQRSLAAGWGQAWSKEGGVYVSAATLPVDSAKLESLVALIVKGLDVVPLEDSPPTRSLH